MHILYLDVASHAGTLACATEKKTMAIETVDHRIDDAELVKRIETILQKAGWSYQDLTHIACAVGPGGFTSLRVGVAAANALAWALKIPSAGVKLWEVYGARCAETKNQKPETKEEKSEKRKKNSGNVWLHSTKKTHVFVKNEKNIEPTCMSLEELKTLLFSFHFSLSTWTGELIPEHQEFVATLGLSPAPVADLSHILPSFLSAQRYLEKTTLLPWYGRGW